MDYKTIIHRIRQRHKNKVFLFPKAQLNKGMGGIQLVEPKFPVAFLRGLEDEINIHYKNGNGGRITTSSILSSVVYYIKQNPDELNKLRDKMIQFKAYQRNAIIENDSTPTTIYLLPELKKFVDDNPDVFEGNYIIGTLSIFLLQEIEEKGWDFFTAIAQQYYLDLVA